MKIVRLIKPKVFIFDGVSYPSLEIQQQTLSIVECVSQMTPTASEEDAMGIICKQSLSHQQSSLWSADLLILTDEQWQDAQQLDRFFTQLYVLQRLEQLSGHLIHHEIIEFHSRHKYLIMAYSPTGYQLTGRLVAGIKKDSDLMVFFAQYKQHLMGIFAQLPAKNIQVNALSHMQGYFKHRATKDEKRRLLWLINDYREGNLSINRPLAMMQQLLIQYPDNYLSQQYYFEPYPNCVQIRELPYR